MNYFTLDSTTCTIPLPEILYSESETSLFYDCNKASQEGIHNIILDFREVSHMNSAGAHALAKLIGKCSMEGINLFSYGLDQPYKDILWNIGLLQKLTLLPVHLETSQLNPTTQEHILAFNKGSGRQETTGWLKHFQRIDAVESFPKAYAMNLKGRSLLGPFQGFGPLWEKKYTLKCYQKGISPEDCIETLKNKLPQFQPPGNYFYPSSKGIEPGEVLVINALTPGGLVSTGVVIMYADEVSFTFITPKGHPEAGWVSFFAHKKEDHIEIQIQGLASSSDPFYELAFRLAGSKLQENIWKTVLSSMASYLGIPPTIELEKTCLWPSLHWPSALNLWNNAQLRSLPFTIPFLMNRPQKSRQRGE